MYDYYTSLPSVFPTFMYGFGQKLKLKYAYDAEMDDSFGFPVFDSLDEEEVFWDDPKWDPIMDQLRLITEAYDKGGPSLVDSKVSSGISTRSDGGQKVKIIGLINPNNNTMDRKELLAGLLESAAVDGGFKLIVKDGQLVMIDLFDEVEPFAVEFSGGDDVQDRFHDLAVTKINP